MKAFMLNKKHLQLFKLYLYQTTTIMTLACN